MVFYRFDDLGQWNENTESFLSLLEGLRLPYIVAAIPKRVDGGSATFLSKAKFASIAQHGFEHVSYAAPPGMDEFPETRPINEVTKRLTEGRKHLEDCIGRAVNGYVPPWNTFSEQTLRVLERAGYRWFSSHVRRPVISSMINVGVAVDVITTYKPLVFSRRDLILQQVAFEQNRRNVVGIVFHVNHVPQDTRIELQKVIGQLAPQSFTLQGWESVLRGHKS